MKTVYAGSYRNSALRKLAAIPVALLITLVFCLPACAQDVIADWDKAKTPPPPELKRVKINPATTVLLLLDFNFQTCNRERRPRCVESIPRVKKLLEAARAKRVMVIYSLSANAIYSDIAKELAPTINDPVISSGPDKFLGTMLDKILRARRIETVIVTGTAANGAVLYTASGAALRGYNVIVPVEGVSAETLYAEQYVLWNLANAPRVSEKTTITRLDMIEF
jgi:nicotinamidase-related amidase